MGKVERVFELAALINEDPGISITELSERCKVSTRTVYRYLGTIRDLEIEISNDVDDTSLRDTVEACELNCADIELLLYCLGNNPLVHYRFFVEKLAIVVSKVEKLLKQLPSTESDGMLEIESFGENSIDSRQSKILERFTSARASSRLVLIKMSGSVDNASSYLPVTIRVTELDLSKVHDLTIEQLRSAASSEPGKTV